MKVCGFTIIRNAIKFDYPVVESIQSILPVCDKFIVAVGDSEDETLDLIKKINSPKIEILQTKWDDNLRKGGKVLAHETNKAFDAIPDNYDWCFYLQSDEVVHEKYLSTIKSNMLKWKDNLKVEGLVFDYTHFYGSYDFIGDSRKWYRKEVRIIRNNKKIRSFRDAQGFQKNWRRLRVKSADAAIYHYGWVKHPKEQQAKQESFNKLWHSDEWMEKNVAKVDEFDYSRVDILSKFKGTHPSIMQKRVDNMNWTFSFDPTEVKLPLKLKVLHYIERLTGWRIGEYKNYRYT